MKPPRGLTADETAAWERLAATVAPLRPRRPEPKTVAEPPRAAGPAFSEPAAPARKAAPVSASGRAQSVAPARRQPAGRGGLELPGPGSSGLDSHWDRQFARGGIAPDFTLDLHGHTLDQAHARLESGLVQAKAIGARVVLVIAGKARPVDAADRGSRRGAIRAKLLDWLASGPHGPHIAAVRNAHRRHGGEGALYLVLKRQR